MMKGADAAGAIAERSLFGELDEILDAVYRQRGTNDQHERYACDQRNQREVFARIVGQAFVQRHVGSERRHRHHDRVAVRRRFREVTSGQNRAGPWPVLHHEGFTKPRLEFLGEKPGEDIGAAGWRKGHDKGDLALGIIFATILGACRPDCDRRQSRREQRAARKC